MSFQPITNDLGNTTGYKYQVEEDGVVSEYTFDTNFEIIGTSITDEAEGTSFSNLVEAGSNGGTTEKGTQIEGDYSRSFEFNYLIYI